MCQSNPRPMLSPRKPIITRPRPMATWLVMAALCQLRGAGAMHRRSDRRVRRPFAGDEVLRLCRDGLRGDPEMREQIAGRRRGAEGVHADEPRLFALAALAEEPAVPAEADAGLDGDAHRARGQHLAAVFLVLRLEEFPARHGDHPGPDAFGLENVAGR